MESSRFFVANLPANTTDNDLKFLFQDYGQIKNIELKTKENLVDPDDIKIIAFVTLGIGAKDAQYCLNDLNWQKVHGKNIKVSLAKESFLERLKREREEAKFGNEETVPRREQQLELQSDLLKVPRENKRKTFDVHSELDDDEVAPELMISKKRATSSIHNGKIVIQNHDVQPIHVIETKHKKKQMDLKSSSADQKRKESLNKMKNQYQQNKTAIQQALQGLDGQSSKKIKFSDAESDQEEHKPEASAKKSKTDIFGSDDDSDSGGKVVLKHVHMGKKGEKLLQMQSKQSVDPRFRINAKFVDDDEDDKCELVDKKGTINNDGYESDIDNERQWQMNILEQVVGTKLDTVKSTDKLPRNKMLRYDPSKDEHQKFERSREEDAQIKKSRRKTKAVHESTAPAEVSKEVFYVVTDTLQQSLRTRGEGFSLLKMFGQTEQFEQRDEQLKQLGNEKILVNNNKSEKSFSINPFKYDSTSESESEEIIKDQENINDDKKTDNTNTQNPKKAGKKFKITKESFFISKNDIRLKEGAKFFIYKKTKDATTENYEEVRNRLKLLIKSKITKTKKNLSNAGYKGKRKA